jgi:hypothetical protein
VQYREVLEKKKGTISEFVNPKYKAGTTSFAKPTRLECMMQDYPKLLGTYSCLNCCLRNRGFPVPTACLSLPPDLLQCLALSRPNLVLNLDACFADKSARVSFTQFERWTAFSAVKNNLADAAAKQRSNSASVRLAPIDVVD